MLFFSFLIKINGFNVKPKVMSNILNKTVLKMDSIIFFLLFAFNIKN